MYKKQSSRLKQTEAIFVPANSEKKTIKEKEIADSSLVRCS